MGQYIFGSSDGWGYFDKQSNQWMQFAPETTKQIDNELHKQWYTSKTEVISFPVTEGQHFQQHAGIYFCRIGLNKKRNRIMECMLVNTELAIDTPMKRKPVFKTPYRRNNNKPKSSYNNRNYGGRQGHHNQRYNKQRNMYVNKVKVTLKGPHGTTVDWMTPQQANYYTMNMMENASICHSGSIVPVYHDNDMNNDNNMNIDDDQDNFNIVHAWDYKNIDDWTCNELQEWIIALGLSTEIEKKVVEAISEQEITGADFNTMVEVSEITDSFEIECDIAQPIWDALVNIRLELNNKMNKYRPENSGIIGLDNLGNTCFINAVIQALLQTPGLIHAIRPMFSTNSCSMLDAFIEVVRASFQNNSQNKSISPKAIVQCLRNSDVKFNYGEQGDALSAVSKMVELLDKHIIERAINEQDTQEEFKHTGSWYVDGLDDIDEDELIFKEWCLYNPDNTSIIRDCIHFVERNIFTCMTCGWYESRYDVKDKVLLPLQDHNMKVHINIYIPSLKTDEPIMQYKGFTVLDYCPILTLRYQIYQEINSSNMEIDLEDINQVSICSVLPNKQDTINNWIKACDYNKNCSDLINTKIFAVIHSVKSEITTVRTYNVFMDKYGNVDEKESYIEFEEMKTGTKKSFINKTQQGYPIKYIFFEKKIFDANYECQINDKNSTIICIWVPQAANDKMRWNKYDMESIDPLLTTEIIDKLDGNEANYEDIIELIQMKINDCSNEKLTDAMITYEALKENEVGVTELCEKGFRNKFNFVQEQKESDIFVGSIKKGFDTYCCTKVMDRGAVVKCRGNCGGLKCDVFKQETKIVQFPEILIFGIDRYIFGQKFEKCVKYKNKLCFDDDNEYELYGVCNHSGGLEYGHYWAFVKGIDDNQWYNANDSKIRQININQVINQETAILLFYKKCKSQNLNNE